MSTSQAQPPDSDLIAALRGLFLIAVAGYGVYRVMKAFGSFERGEIVGKDELAADPASYEALEHSHYEPEMCCRCGEKPVYEERTGLCWGCVGKDLDD